MATKLTDLAATAPPVEGARAPASPAPTSPPAPSRAAATHRRPSRRASSTPSIRLSDPPRIFRRVGWILLVIFIVLPLLLALVPWRQAVYGDGTVIAYHPFNRPFTVESPIYGRVIEYFVVEGSKVSKGDRIADIVDIDPQFTATIQLQLDSAEFALENLTAQKRTYEANKLALTATGQNEIAAAQAQVKAYEQKVDEMTAKRDEQKALLANDLNVATITENLYKKGLESYEKFIGDRQKFAAAEQKLEQSEKALLGASEDLNSAREKLKATGNKWDAEIAKAQAEIDAAGAKIRDQEIKIADFGVKLRRQNTHVIAPREGYVLRIHQNTEAGAQVKDGDPIATIVPLTRPEDMAAEIYLPGRDIPLVHAGDPVRLQFDGWPAVQFIGWPSIAVGTFPGKVALVDRTQTKGGKFRVLVVPDPKQLKHRDPARLAKELRASSGWPVEQYLRQGAGVKGWVLLQEVPLGFEIWRRMNGFQPVIINTLPADKTDKLGTDDKTEPGGKDEKPKLKRPK